MLTQIEIQIEKLEDQAIAYVLDQLQQYSNKRGVEVHLSNMVFGDCFVKYSDHPRPKWLYSNLEKRYYMGYDLPIKYQNMIRKYEEMFRRDLAFQIIKPRLNHV